MRCARRFERDGSLEVYERIDLPLVSTLAQMERVGARIDVDKLACMAQETTTELEGLRAEIHELAGEEFNVDSPKQLGHILFEVLELPAGKKNSRGYSTDAKRSASSWTCIPSRPRCCAIASSRK